MTPQEFKLTVKHRLIDRGMYQSELIAQVRKKTGKYLDRSLLNKIYKGERYPEAIIQAIREILELPQL